MAANTSRFFGYFTTKALRRLSLVPPCQQIVTQRIQILGQIRFKLDDIRHLVLMPRRIVIGHIEVIQQLVAGQPVTLNICICH